MTLKCTKFKYNAVQIDMFLNFIINYTKNSKFFSQSNGVLQSKLNYFYISLKCVKIFVFWQGMQNPPNSIIKALPEFIKFIGKIIYLLSKYRITRVPGAVHTLTWFETGCWCRDDQGRDTGRLWLMPISQFPWARYPFDQTAKKDQ